MPTISAYAPDELKREIDRVAREEGRSQAQVATTALELYAALSPAARGALLQLRAAGLLEGVVAEMGRALLSARWDVLSGTIDREIASRGELPEGELSEEEIAKIAVEMTSRPPGHRRKRAAG